MSSVFKKGIRDLIYRRSCLHRLFVSRYYANTGNSDDQNDTFRGYKLAPDPEGYKNPLKVLKNDWDISRKKKTLDSVLPVPRETDMVVVGGGAIGMACAYWLKVRNPRAVAVTVIEQDPTYARASTVLSVGGIRQQFSLKENIEMSLFCAEFLREIKEHLSLPEHDPPDIQFNPQGYLFLATEKGTHILEENHKTQIECGAKVELMGATKLKQQFPWLNVEDIAMGSYGLQNEGWFDPWLFLAAMKAKCSSLGVKFVNGEVIGFQSKTAKPLITSAGEVVKRSLLENILVKVGDIAHPMRFAACINAAGPWAAKVAEMADIGVGEGPMKIGLPVEPRKRYVFLVHCPDGPGLETPMIIDPSGVYVRREGLGGHYICGVSPGDLPRGDHGDEVDVKYYEDQLLPMLINRIPAFRNSELKSAWAGYYDYNHFDENLIIGNHPHHRNFFFATGCSGHGIQQAIAIGRGISELMFDNEFQTIDLSRFSFDRIIDQEPVFETNCV